MGKNFNTIKDNNVDHDNNSIPAMRQRIAELETKLEEVEGQYAYECECNKQLVELQEENKQLKALLTADDKMKTNSLAGFKKLLEENAKLQEQLKNALQDIQNFIERKMTASKKASQEYIDGYCACGCNINDYIEDEVKPEAQKYLEERK